MFVTSPSADNALVAQAPRALKPELEAASLRPEHAGGARARKIFVQPLEESARGSALVLADGPLHLKHQLGANGIQLALRIVHALLRQTMERGPRLWMRLEQQTR